MAGIRIPSPCTQTPQRGLRSPHISCTPLVPTPLWRQTMPCRHSASPCLRPSPHTLPRAALPHMLQDQAQKQGQDPGQGRVQEQGQGQDQGKEQKTGQHKDRQVSLGMPVLPGTSLVLLVSCQLLPPPGLQQWLRGGGAQAGSRGSGDSATGMPGTGGGGVPGKLPGQGWASCQRGPG